MIENKKHYDFIEIGTSDFDTLIESSDNETTGISIEPIKYYINKLPNKNKVIKVQAALSTTDGNVDVYYIDEQKITDNNLPWWIRGSNSINNPHPFAIKELGEELYNSLVTIEKAPSISWKTLIETYGVESIGYLKIDAEGHDHIIMRDFLNYCKEHSFPTPNKITLEYHDGVSNKVEIDNLISELPEYQITKDISDITLVKPKIPRIIHQTYKTNDLPSEILEVVQKLRSMNPTFEYKFYNDEDCIEFIRENYDEETLNLYLSINPVYGAARADFFRYLLMYKVGGVYLDIKSCTITPLEETLLPTDEFLLTHWEGLDWADELNYQFGEFQNWHIICRPEHPFLYRAIEIVKENIKNYLGGSDKNTVLRVTGPIAYSKGIVELISKHKTNHINSPVREFLLENEIGLKYISTKIHHHNLYGKSFSRVEPLIIKEKVDKAYVLYSTENYFEIVKTCIKSIRKYSDLPIFVYLINSDLKIDIKDVVTLRWDLDIDEEDDSLMYINSKDNFYINRNNKKIYKILIQRPLITKDVLEKYTKTVAYIDSDSIATPYVDSIFKLTENKNYPYFVQGIYDYLHVGDRGGAVSRDDLSTTLEHPACELFGVNQYVRDKYRQTGYYVANESCIDFLNEWYEMCIHPTVLSDISYYAAYNEETILNVLLWKKEILDGLPYMYTNGGSDFVDKVYSDSNINESVLWVKLPKNKENLLFFHGEKRIPEMNKMIQKIKRYHDEKKRILFLAPHLSTGGMPAFVLKTIQSLGNSVEIFVVEYQCHSLDFVVQRNAIKEIVGNNFKTLYEDKMELFDVISNWNPDIIHIHDCAERLDRKLITKLYNNDRTYHIIETCHDVSFNPGLEKIVHPDYYAFCTPYHLETFAHLPSKKELIEFPIDPLVPTKSQILDAKWTLGMHVSKYHVVNIGLWTSGKNQGEMLELAKKMPDVEFHFVGNQAGNFKDYWEPLMADVPKNVTIWGERDDTDVFMKAADVFMFNSVWECNPLVLREAISNNKKIIARNLPQYKDMFTSYITNLNPNDLENQLREVLDSDDSYVISKSNTTEVFKTNLLNLYEKTFKSDKESNDIKDYNITQHFVGQPFLEITGTSDSLFTVEFYDHKDTLIYRNKIKCNHWVKVNREYFTKWKVLVYKDDELVYNTVLDYTNKRVYISFESASLGDTIAWIPYALEFKKKHNCHVIVSTFKNFLFESVYPELEFVVPGTIVNNLQGMYKIGWFYDDNKEPSLPNTIPLQQTATNILGLEFQEIRPRLSFSPGNNLYGKYVTIATNSTAGCKFWTKEGWQEVINFLVDKGYKVINVSKEKNPFHNCTQIEDTSMDNTISTIHHSEFTIALSSGLGWLSWILGKQVVMISNFSQENHEFKCIRITNTNVCHGCWNDPQFKFDKGDYNWCPLHKNTPRHFECHRGISSQKVIDVLPI